MKKIKKFIKSTLGQKNSDFFFVAVNFFRIHARRALRAFRTETRASEEKKIYSCEEYFIKDKNIFFGYYDKTPFSMDGKLILAQVAGGKNKSPKEGEEITIGYFDRKKNKKFNKIGTTTTWCWQQGCRLQWFPTSDGELIIYNKLLDGRYSSVIQNIKTKQITRTHSFPIYDVSRSGEEALTLNFSRLHRLRPGYGYADIEDDTKSEKIPAHDGVWIADLTNGKKRLLLGLKEIVEIEKKYSMRNATHYVNFISYNKDGSKFAFLHIWEKKEEPRFVRLIVYDQKSGQCLIPTSDRVSHFSWIGKTKLVFTAKTESEKVHHFVYDLKTKEKRIIGEKQLTKDGHPSFFKGTEKFITDAFIDEYGERALFLFDVKKNKKWELFRSVVPRGFVGEMRCDFHPRWDNSGNFICIDCPVKKHRRMTVFDIQKIS